MSDFVFATDIMQKMNELNKKLQGKEVFAHDLYLEVKLFQTKLTLFGKQMSNKLITGLREEFARRFADFNAMEHEFDLLKSPFLCNV